MTKSGAMQRHVAHQDMISDNGDSAATRCHSVIDCSCLLNVRSCLIHTTVSMTIVWNNLKFIRAMRRFLN